MEKFQTLSQTNSLLREGKGRSYSRVSELWSGLDCGSCLKHVNQPLRDPGGTILGWENLKNLFNWHIHNKFFMCDTDINKMFVFESMTPNLLRLLPLSSNYQSGNKLKLRKTDSMKESWNRTNETSPILLRQTAFSCFSQKQNPRPSFLTLLQGRSKVKEATRLVRLPASRRVKS